jgi:hypothetical protein
VPVEADRWTDPRCLREIGLDRLGVFEAVDQGVNRAAAGKACGKQASSAPILPLRDLAHAIPSAKRTYSQSGRLMIRMARPDLGGS